MLVILVDAGCRRYGFRLHLPGAFRSDCDAELLSDENLPDARFPHSSICAPDIPGAPLAEPSRRRATDLLCPRSLDHNPCIHCPRNTAVMNAEPDFSLLSKPLGSQGSLPTPLRGGASMASAGSRTPDHPGDPGPVRLVMSEDANALATYAIAQCREERIAYSRTLSPP